MSETQHASAQQGSVASTTANGQQVPDVAQWAAMQAFYKNSGAPQTPFLPPGFPPGSGAYAAQFWGAGGPAPILYNPQLMSGLGGMNPYAFMQGAVSQSRQPDRIAEPGGVLSAKPPSSKDLRQQDAQEANPKRPKRERSVADLKQAGDNVPEPSRSGSGGTASPASEPNSEQRNAGSAGASADFERQPSHGHIGASSSAQNLAAGGGGVAGLQDEREVKKLRRKQSNRESARRSRLRKQAECEALSGKVAHLEQENGQLKDANRALMVQLQELQRMVSQTEQRGPQPSGLLNPVPGDGSAFTPVAPPARPAPDSSIGVAAEHRSSPPLPSTQTSELGQAAPQAPVAPTDGA